MSNKRARRPAPAPSGSPAGRYVIAYIHPGQVSAYFCQSLVGTLLYDRATHQQVGGILNEWSSANVSNARNRIVRQFLDQRDADWLLMVDADMAWAVDDPARLMAVADVDQAPIVGGLCFGTAEDVLFPTIYHLGEQNGEPITMRLHNYPDDTIFRCSATGAAFLLVHRSVFERVLEADANPAFPWFQETRLGAEPVSEDLTFCLRAGVLGIPVHVHTGVHIGHHKTTVLTHEKFRAQTPPHAEMTEEVDELDDDSESRQATGNAR